MKHPKSYDSTPETRKRMSKVKLKGGKAEILLAKALWHQGYRYRKNDKRLPGSPDIAILKYHIAVFVDGEFWHGKDWEARKMRLKRNREYWIEKSKKTWLATFGTTICWCRLDGSPFTFGKRKSSKTYRHVLLRSRKSSLHS